MGYYVPSSLYTSKILSHANFRIFRLTFFIFFFFFLSHRPSALRKGGTSLIFIQNVTTGDRGVHRPQEINSFLFYDTEQIPGP